MKTGERFLGWEGGGGEVILEIGNDSAYFRAVAGDLLAHVEV